MDVHGKVGKNREFDRKELEFKDWEKPEFQPGSTLMPRMVGFRANPSKSSNFPFHICKMDNGISLSRTLLDGSDGVWRCKLLRRCQAYSKCPINAGLACCLKSGSTTDAEMLDAGKQCRESRACILPGSRES